MSLRLAFTAELWQYPGEGSWHFVSLPTELADEVRAYSPRRAGFGSVRVRATIGSATWFTSVFPDTKSNTFLLPVKRAVRDANELADGDAVSVTLEIAQSD